MRPPGSRGESLLITHGAGANLSGVEWRMPAVGLSSGVRIAAASSLPVSGWQQTFDRIDATLHLPYGYQLLAAPGADSVRGSWISRWTLLDVFVAAIIALLAWRLLGIAGALAATLYLLLGYHEEAPTWTLLAVLALSLIVRALPAGRLHGAGLWLRRAAWAVFVLVALPFVADEVRYALYPQLEHTSVFADCRTAAAPISRPTAAATGAATIRLCRERRKDARSAGRGGRCRRHRHRPRQRRCRWR